MKLIRRTLIMMLAFALCCACLALTGCGGKDKEEPPVNETTEETAPQEQLEEESGEGNGTAYVDKIDADIHCEDKYTYHDDTEGYDRELNTSDHRSMKYIDYSLIQSDDVTLIALHFERERQFTATNPDGTENTEYYRRAREFATIDMENTAFAFDVVQDATNKDTGEKVELHLDEAPEDYFQIYEPKDIQYPIQESIVKWKEEKGLVNGERIMEFIGENPEYYVDPCAGDGWCFPDCYVERLMMVNGKQDHVTLDDMGSPLDVYYFYELKNPTAPVVITFRTGVREAGDIAITSTKPVEQIMTIDIA